MPDLPFYQRAAQLVPAPTTAEGESGYLSAPASTLDPNLFETDDDIRPEVRNVIVSRLISWLESRGFREIPHWLYAWIAGSGVSYQWAAARGEGDLDVLFGIDMIPFQAANPGFAGWSYADLAPELNSALKEDLWSQTAHTEFGRQSYEVTYYLNPGVGASIDIIHPYAAYEVYPGNSWDIRPPQLPTDPRDLYPQEWFTRAEFDASRARELTGRYNRLMQRINASVPGSPGWHTAGAGLHMTVAMASALFSDLHEGRHEAFSVRGQGYGDWNNFRWQQGKASGAVQAMHQIMTVGETARAEEETALYGAPIAPADVALHRAAAAHRTNPLAR